MPTPTHERAIRLVFTSFAVLNKRNPPPATEEATTLDALVRLWGEHLGGYSPADIERAGRVWSARSPFWPDLSEFLAVLAEARAPRTVHADALWTQLVRQYPNYSPRSARGQRYDASRGAFLRCPEAARQAQAELLAELAGGDSELQSALQSAVDGIGWDRLGDATHDIERDRLGRRFASILSIQYQRQKALSGEPSLLRLMGGA